MARITVEDCIDKFPSRFELVLVASNRARKLHSGEDPTLDKDNDKNTVIALREIAEETLSIEELKNSLIEDYQTVSLSEEEEELSLDISEDEEVDVNIRLDKEIKNLVSNEDKEINNLEDTNENSTEIDLEDTNENSTEIDLEDTNENSTEIDIEENNSNSESEILK